MYLAKETGQWIKRERKPDPHIATATARLLGPDGRVMAGKAVLFRWDMPGSGAGPQRRHGP